MLEARPHAERMAERVAQLGAVQRVEMEFFHAVLLQLLHLFDRHRRGDQAARLGIVVQAVEAMRQPVGHARATAPRHAQHLRKTRDRQDARHDAGLDAGRGTAIPEAQEQAGVEEELRDGAIGAGVDLGSEIHQLEVRIGRFRMRLGIGGYGNLEIGHRLQTFHQVDRVREALRVRNILAARALRRITTQRDDVTNAIRPIVAGDSQYFLARRADTGQMRSGGQRGALLYLRDDVVSARASRAVGTVSHRHEARLQRRQAFDRSPQCLLHRLVLGREELERHRGPATQPARGVADLILESFCRHQFFLEVGGFMPPPCCLPRVDQSQPAGGQIRYRRDARGRFPARPWQTSRAKWRWDWPATPHSRSRSPR
jgi:hypothetical protein